MPKPAATPRDNLLRSLRRQGFDRVPLDSGAFCTSQLEAFRKRFGHDDYRSFFNCPFRFVNVPAEATFTDGRALYPREELPADIDFDQYGVGHSRQEGCFHMTRMHHPLKGEDVTLDEIRNYPFPVLQPDAEATMRAQVDALHEQGLAAMAGLGCTTWESSWYMRSMEDLMTDMMTDDERATLLFDRMNDNCRQRVVTAAKAGCDLIQLGDDIGMQSSPMMAVPLWEKWLKPRLKQVTDAAREIKPDILIFYHSCGFIIPFIDGLIEAGVDILNPVQPECMSFAEVHRRFGDRLSFWSTIGTQTTLPFGTPQEVRRVVTENLRICGSKGGIVIGPTHVVEPEVPWENLLAMKEACEQFTG